MIDGHFDYKADVIIFSGLIIIALYLWDFLL
jgi:hypothetical protein